MNTNRVFPRSAERIGLIATSESKRVILPLKGVECDFSIQGGIVEVAMVQIFRQENPKPLDCDYIFPLPADASVYCCEADINGRIIRAKVRERFEAVKLANEKKDEGHRVVLVESERENLFTLTLSNLQPDDFIVVKLKYLQPLRLLADLPSVEIPFCPGVRYIPGNPLIRSNLGRGVVDDTGQVPDASRISPVRMHKDHPDAAYIDIRGTMEGRFVDAASVVSPSHKIVSQNDDDHLSIRLSEKDEVPDRDFVLRWRERAPEAITSRAWVQNMGNEVYALLEIRAPKAATAEAKPMDFYFLVDRSGSMEGEKWQKAALAVQSCVKALGEKDRAMLTLFGTHWTDFAEQPLPPRQLLADPNFQNVSHLPLDGGTELEPALRHVLEIAARHSPKQAKSLILITDAQIGNEAAILKLMEPSRDFPMHCFGIDTVLNDAPLLALARQQRGTFHSLNPADDVAKAITELAQTIRHPVLQDLHLPDSWETAGAGIPPLYSGQIYHLSAVTTTKEPLELTARNGGSGPVTIPMTSRAAAGDVPWLHWSKQRIQRYIAEDKTGEAIALSVKANLICPLTAFIAWDETEQVAVASQALAQPILQARMGTRDLSVRSPSAGGWVARRALRDALDGPADIVNRSPADVVRRIVDDMESSGFIPMGNPFTMPERLEAFRKLFTEICLLCGHPDWMPMCERMLDWMTENQPQAMQRSNRVAQLLAELMQQVGPLRSRRSEMEANITRLRENNTRASEAIAALQKIVRWGMLDQQKPTEILERIKNTNDVMLATQLEHDLRTVAAMETDIREKLTRLLQPR